MVDLNDLQGFVTLAMSDGTCEDNLAMGRMSNLRAVGTDFATLIFDLSPSSSLPDIVEKCSPIWEALETRKDLPIILVIFLILY